MVGLAGWADEEEGGAEGAAERWEGRLGAALSASVGIINSISVR